MTLFVRLIGKPRLAVFVVDTDDHIEAIEIVKQEVGSQAASPVLALIEGGKQARA